MRDRFVGDVGDFGKYGLLRVLSGRDLRLGVLWYFVGDRMTHYLEQPGKFRDCDEKLFDTLRVLVGGCQRSVATVEKRKILPRDTVFFREPVPPQAEMRQAWLDCALKKTRDCGVVFLDPDNGLADAPFGEGRISPKHAYYEELEPFLRREQSLILWHQPGFLKGAVPLLLAEIESRFPGYEIHALTHHRVVFRAFFVISARKHRQLLAGRIARFLESSWGQHFERAQCRTDP
jgi:hypothetical protein